ncbi:hypothetical protein DENSPDRAFT_691282 [Dentipellis sp. KUC8613]|nr:hypothetical protein DENSPDRAFT_691282 [Dentipellis sp. KUC8613]
MFSGTFLGPLGPANPRLLPKGGCTPYVVYADAQPARPPAFLFRRVRPCAPPLIVPSRRTFRDGVYVSGCLLVPFVQLSIPSLSEVQSPMMSLTGTCCAHRLPTAPRRAFPRALVNAFLAPAPAHVYSSGHCGLYDPGACLFVILSEPYYCLLCDLVEEPGRSGQGLVCGCE